MDDEKFNIVKIVAEPLASGLGEACKTLSLDLDNWVNISIETKALETVTKEFFSYQKTVEEHTTKRFEIDNTTKTALAQIEMQKEKNHQDFQTSMSGRKEFFEEVCPAIRKACSMNDLNSVIELSKIAANVLIQAKNT